jgi:regulator of replication initiation timing
MTTTDADDLKARFDGDGEAMKETLYSGPCSICGDTNYPLSMGGSSICPSCDCGDYGITKVRRQGKRIAELVKQVDDWRELWTKENEQRVELQTETESLRERLAKAEARATAAETAAAQMHGNSDGYAGAMVERDNAYAMMREAIDNCETCRGNRGSCARCKSFMSVLSAAATAPQGGRE